MTKGDSLGAKWVVALVLVVILAVGFVAIAASRLELPLGRHAVYDAEMGEVNCGAWLSDLSVKGEGRFPDGVNDQRKNGEIFDKTVVFFAWFQDGESQQIIGEGIQRSCSWDPLDPARAEDAEYRFFIDNGDGKFRSFYQDRVPTSVVHTKPNKGEYMGAFSFSIDGYEFCTVDTTNGCPKDNVEVIKDGAILKVEMWVQNTLDDNWFNIGKDEMDLRSAIPEVWWSKGGYKIGDTAQVFWDIPIVDDDNGNPLYFLTVRDMNTGVPLSGFDRTPLESTGGSVSIEVKDTMFSNDLNTCQNRLRAEIYTPLIKADLADATVKSPDVKISGGVPPEVVSLNFDKKEYYEGDTVVITWDWKGNVTKSHITAHIGGLIVLDKDIDAPTKEASFIAPRTGVLEVEATCYDYCQPSDVRKEQATVGNVYPGLCEVYPDLPQCTNENNWWLIVIAIIVLIACIVAFVLVYMGVKLFTDSVYVSFLVALFVACLIALGAKASGVFDVFFGVI